MGFGRAPLLGKVVREGVPVALIVVLAACGGRSATDLSSVASARSSDTVATTATMSPFCTHVLAVLDKTSFPTDGGTVVNDLRGVSMDELSIADRDAVVASIDHLERDLDAFNNGGSLDGWSTAPMASVIERVCDVTGLNTWHVMP